MKDIRVAVLGASGWMGRVHSMAWQTYPHFFGASAPRARIVALGSTSATAEDLATLVPGARIEADWRALVRAPDIDLIDICLPDALHYPVAKAALEAGKHVFCEKPLADTAAEAHELADLARAKGLITRVGHGFPRNPVHDLARDILRSGELGEIRLFKGCQHVDVFGDPLAPFMWRADGQLAPTGIVGDTGSHVFSFMEFLVGRVASLIADTMIVTPRRPQAEGSGAAPHDSTTWAEVTNPDAAHVMCRFENGAAGVVDFSRVATGRKFHQAYEIYGTKGSLVFDYDQVNRLHFYSNDDRGGRRGYRAIDVGPEHANYRAFLPLPNFALGYNETKIIEVAELARSIASGQEMWPGFDVGHHICQIVEACMISSRERRWVDLAAV